uniref:HECT domain-containing protein n=1 Tax=Parastrongyloides trichosuri TaxID=131310 RepID=A0A0N4ZAB9_PARTI
MSDFINILQQNLICRRVLRELDSIHDIGNLVKAVPSVDYFATKYTSRKHIESCEDFQYFNITYKVPENVFVKKRTKWNLRRSLMGMARKEKYVANAKHLRHKKIKEVSEKIRQNSTPFIITRLFAPETYRKDKCFGNLRPTDKCPESRHEHVTKLKIFIFNCYDSPTAKESKAIGEIFARYTNALLRKFRNLKSIDLNINDELTAYGYQYHYIKNLNSNQIKEISGVDLEELIFYTHTFSVNNLAIFSHLKGLNLVNFSIKNPCWRENINIIKRKTIQVLNDIKKIKGCQIGINRYRPSFLEHPVEFLLKTACSLGIYYKLYGFPAEPNSYNPIRILIKPLYLKFITHLVFRYDDSDMSFYFIDFVVKMKQLESLEICCNFFPHTNTKEKFAHFMRDHIRRITLAGRRAKEDLKIRSYILKYNSSDDNNTWSEAAIMAVIDAFIRIIPPSVTCLHLNYPGFFDDNFASNLVDDAPDIQNLTISQCSEISKFFLFSFKKLENFCYCGSKYIKIPSSVKLLTYFLKEDIDFKELNEYSDEDPEKTHLKQWVFNVNYFSFLFKHRLSIYRNRHKKYFIYFNEYDKFDNHFSLLETTFCDASSMEEAADDYYIEIMSS